MNNNSRKFYREKEVTIKLFIYSALTLIFFIISVLWYIESNPVKCHEFINWWSKVDFIEIIKSPF